MESSQRSWHHMASLGSKELILGLLLSAVSYGQERVINWFWSCMLSLFMRFMSWTKSELIKWDLTTTEVYVLASDHYWKWMKTAVGTLALIEHDCAIIQGGDVLLLEHGRLYEVTQSVYKPNCGSSSDVADIKTRRETMCRSKREVMCLCGVLAWTVSTASTLTHARSLMHV